MATIHAELSSCLDVERAFRGKAEIWSQCYKTFFPSPRPSNFSDYSFWAHHPANQDDRHLLSHAVASDFSVAWQFFSKRTIVFLLWINLLAHALMYKNLQMAVVVTRSRNA
jgi:hypothetical protein